MSTTLSRRQFVSASALAMAGLASAVAAQVSSSEYGFAARRPIMQGACPTCVGGPFALTTKQIMARYGYDIQICWNCNRHESPRFGADARVPHDLTPDVAFALETLVSVVERKSGEFKASILLLSDDGRHLLGFPCH